MRKRREKHQDGARIDRLGGIVERFTFRNAETGYAVVRFDPDGPEPPVALVGTLAQLAEGQRVTISGTRREHPRYGAQIEVESAEVSVPTSVEGIKAYLGSSLVKGIGPAMAERITDAFGADTLRIIDEEPDRLAAVRGLGPKKIEELRAAIASQRDVQEVMVFLRAHGLGPALATRIVKQFGRNAVGLIQDNPYRLADEVIGVGFRRADQLAESLGITGDAPARIAAGIEHVLGQGAREGHCFLPRSALRERAAALLGCDEEAVVAQLGPLAERERVRLEPLSADASELAVYPARLHAAECGVAALLDRLADAAAPPLPLDAGRALEWYVARAGMHLPDGQRIAIHTGLTAPVSVITGGPGVGKTTIIRALVEIVQAKHLRLVLAAPTGRAAKRLEESTECPASTLHRLLEFQPGRASFVRDGDNPIEADLVVVDEASMIDVQLAEDLLAALRPPTKLVLVGDVDQLPSVGPGRVLADVIDSGRVPVTRLTEIFRQEGDSAIIHAAHAILAGEDPLAAAAGEDDPDAVAGDVATGARDFFFVEARDSAHARNLIREIVTQRLPQAFGFDPLRDVQVLCPMYRGETGADALNADLQEALNPSGGGNPKTVGRGLRRGDRVLQTRNDYDLDVYNGDAGRIVSIDPATGRTRVDFGEREVEFSAAEVDALVPAYAISVHRSQGSEYPAVVLPVTNDHFLMLRRNLLYTAVTRGKRMVVLVGTRQALRTAVQNGDENLRHSQLAARLAARARSADSTDA